MNNYMFDPINLIPTKVTFTFTDLSFDHGEYLLTMTYSLKLKYLPVKNYYCSRITQKIYSPNYAVINVLFCLFLGSLIPNQYFV